MAKATVVVTAKNNLKKELDPAKKSMLEFQSYVDGISKKISKAFSIAGVVTATVTAVKTLVKVGAECVKTYGEAEKVFKRLEAVWTNVGDTTGKSYAQVMNYADAIEKSTYFTGEAVEEAALLLAATESLTEDGFERALDASIDLAAALGEDVTSAAQTLSKAIQEPESALSRLKTIGVSFTEAEKEQIQALTDANKLYEAQSLILDKVEAKYQGVAKAVADTPMGTLDAIKDTWGDIKEDLGEGIVGALAPAFNFILGMLKKIHEWARDHIDTKNFWNDVESFNPDTLYQGYTEDFLKQRQAEARSDVAAQLELIKNSPWGQWISEAIETPLEDLLWMENSTLEKVLKDYLPENFEYTLEGFFEDLKDPYDKLVKTSETIEGALTKYQKAYTLETPTSSSSAAKEIGDEVADALTEFLSNYGGSTADLHVSDYMEIIDEAKLLINDLIDWQDEEESGTMALLKSVDKFNLKTSQQVNNAFVALSKIITDSETKIEDIYDSIKPSTTLAAILGGGKLSLFDDDSFAFSPGTTFTFTGKNTSNNGGTMVQSLLDKFTEGLANFMESNGWGDSDQTASAASSVLGSFMNNLGEAGTLVANLAQNMASMGPALGAIVTAFEYVVQGFAEVMGDTIGEFVEYGLEPIREIGRVIGNVLLPIMDAVMPSIQESAEFLIMIFDTIGEVLGPIARSIGGILQPLLDSIVGTLEFLEPIIKAVGNAFIVVGSVFEWVGQWIQHIIASVLNWLASLHVGSWYMFGGMRTNDPGAPGDLASFIGNALIDMDSTATESASTDTAISSASYRGATQVTINIYQMSPVVGENGMREFAQMIREEFEALDYYGVSA